MNHLTRLGIGLGICTAAAGSLLAVRAPLAELSAWQATLVLTAHQEGILQQGLGEVTERHAARARVLDDLAGGGITLPAAAARFRDINAGMPAYVQEIVAHNYQSYPEPERDCRAVIEYLRHYIRDSAPRDQLIGRLENDLCDLLHANLPSAETDKPLESR